MYCNRRVAELLPIYQQFNRFFDAEKLGLHVHAMVPADTWDIEDGTVRITALAACHDTTGGEQPLISILQASGKTVLYACDTGWFPEETWREVEKRQFDAVVLECTCHELMECRCGHLSIGPFLEIKALFDQRGLVSAGGRFIAQHMIHLHRGDDPSAKHLAAAFAEHDVEVAYDGMILNL